MYIVLGATFSYISRLSLITRKPVPAHNRPLERSWPTYISIFGTRRYELPVNSIKHVYENGIVDFHKRKYLMYRT